MSDKIKQLEKQLAAAKAEELENKIKEQGFEVVVFDENDDLVEKYVKPQELTDSGQFLLTAGIGELAEHYERVKEIADDLKSGRLGDWLQFMLITEEPMKKIIAGAFDLEINEVATLPNIDLVGTLIEQNSWINEKAERLGKELQYIGKKYKDQSAEQSSK